MGRTGADACFILLPSRVPLCTSVCVPELRRRRGWPHLTRRVPDHPWELPLPQRLWGPRPEPVRRAGGWGRGKAGSLPLGFQLPPVQVEATEPEDLGREATGVGEGLEFEGGEAASRSLKQMGGPPPESCKDYGLGTVST